jgi:hypothetical protein
MLELKIIKGKANSMSPINNERRQILIPRIIMDGIIDRFEVFRNNVEGHH